MEGQPFVPHEDVAELAITALADTYADKSGGVSADELRLAVQQAAVSLKGRMDVREGEVEALVENAISRQGSASHFEVTRRKIARWFEVALDEFDQLTLDRLVPDVLFKHVYYENMIATWFKEWGYAVRVGEELEGIGGTDFIPDVYAELSTLHGHFAVAVTLYCSNPPNTWRVLGMLENLEAFTQRATDFSQRDIYLMVTPFAFLEQATKHIRLQAEEEKYYVVDIEGNELDDLERADHPIERLKRLQSLVEKVARGKYDDTF